MEVLQKKLKGLLKYRILENKIIEDKNQLIYIIKQQCSSLVIENDTTIQNVSVGEYDAEYFDQSDFRLNIHTNDIINKITNNLSSLNYNLFDVRLLSTKGEKKPVFDDDNVYEFIQTKLESRFLNKLGVSEKVIKELFLLFFQPKFIKLLAFRKLTKLINKSNGLSEIYREDLEYVIKYEEHLIKFLEILLDYNSYEASKVIHKLKSEDENDIVTIKKRLNTINTFELNENQLNILFHYLYYVKDIVLSKGENLPEIYQELKQNDSTWRRGIL